MLYLLACISHTFHWNNFSLELKPDLNHARTKLIPMHVKYLNVCGGRSLPRNSLPECGRKKKTNKQTLKCIHPKRCTENDRMKTLTSSEFPQPSCSNVVSDSRAGRVDKQNKDPTHTKTIPTRSIWYSMRPRGRRRIIIRKWLLGGTSGFRSNDDEIPILRRGQTVAPRSSWSWLLLEDHRRRWYAPRKEEHTHNRRTHGHPEQPDIATSLWWKKCVAWRSSGEETKKAAVRLRVENRNVNELISDQAQLLLRVVDGCCFGSHKRDRVWMMGSGEMGGRGCVSSNLRRPIFGPNQTQCFECWVWRNPGCVPKFEVLVYSG